MKNLKLFTFALLTTFLSSCEKEEVTNIDSTTQNAEVGAKGQKIKHLKNLGYTLTRWNNKGESHIIDIDGAQVAAFGPSADYPNEAPFVNYFRNTRKGLPKQFTQSGLNRYTFTSKRKLRFDVVINFDYTILGGTPFAYNFTRKIKKGERVSIFRKILPRDAKNTNGINITLQ